MKSSTASELPAIAQTLRERVTVIRESSDCVEWLWNGQHFRILQTRTWLACRNGRFHG
jgi:hypothetical protein